MNRTTNKTNADNVISDPIWPRKHASEAAPLVEDRIIRAPERRKIVPYSDMHIWRLEKAGRFPKRIKLGPQSVGWSLREILEYIEARKAERETGAV